MNDRVAVICTKNPNQILLNTVNSLVKFYPEFDILIIDSDSTQTDIYTQLPSNITVEMAKNKNWEHGAWHYAYHKYKDVYSVYMFIQDVLTPNQRIPGFDSTSFPKKTLYSFHYNSVLYVGGYLEHFIDTFKDTKLHFLSEMSRDTHFIGTAHNSFIIHRDDINEIILQVDDVYIEKQIAKCKIDSWLGERIGGILADREGLNRIDISPYFLKTSMNRA